MTAANRVICYPDQVALIIVRNDYWEPLENFLQQPQLQGRDSSYIRVHSMAITEFLQRL